MEACANRITIEYNESVPSLMTANMLTISGVSKDTETIFLRARAKRNRSVEPTRQLLKSARPKLLYTFQVTSDHGHASPARPFFSPIFHEKSNGTTCWSARYLKGDRP